MREPDRGELVGSINLVRWLPCLADPSKIIVIGETDATIDVVMPLLNAILPNVISYYPLAGVMSLRRRPGLITLYPRRVQITQVDDVDDGLRMLAAVRDLLNQTWARRDQIEPKTETRRVPRPLDVYELLPRSNCRACGAATCMAFAFGILESRYEPADCPGLNQAEFDGRRQALIDMLPPKGGADQRPLNLHNF
jgi:ArsR family metal-binding transcriptional regulator